MNESNQKIDRIRSFINALTALFFLLFAAYHTYLYTQVEASRTGRLLGVISFVMIAAASVFALIPRSAFSVMRTVLLVSGLGLNFTIRLLNIPYIFGRLDFDNIPSVLNCTIYVLGQLAELLLLFYYLVFRHNKKLNSKRKFVIALMSFVILLYTACLVMECVLLMKYSVNIDLSRTYTVISRFLYFFGFVSIAAGFMLPIQKAVKSAELMNQPPDENELLFSTAKSSHDKSHKHKAKTALPSDYGKDLLFSESKSSREKSGKHKTKTALPSDYGSDLIFSESKSSRDKNKHKSKKNTALPSNYGNDLMFSKSESSLDKPDKNKKNAALPNDYDDDFVL